LTVCQVHTAVNAVIQSWFLDPESAARLIEATAKRLQYIQQRNAEARRCHTKTRIALLENRHDIQFPLPDDAIQDSS
jgi:hypothetical protein